ncbi:hypothetical protein OG21DRAFT_1508417 [Imleria badia]|nr:hypothetical protein OG21DRAFT_1508417 [Imleria badia]
MSTLSLAATVNLCVYWLETIHVIPTGFRLRIGMVDSTMAGGAGGGIACQHGSKGPDCVDVIILKHLANDTLSLSSSLLSSLVSFPSLRELTMSTYARNPLSRCCCSGWKQRSLHGYLRSLVPSRQVTDSPFPVNRVIQGVHAYRVYNCIVNVDGPIFLA